MPTENGLGECFSTLPTTGEYIYYNQTKILKKECDLLTIKDNSNNIIVVNGENCVSQCPSGYYEYVNEKICKENYDSDYYVIEESNIKKCISESNCKKYKYIPADINSEKKWIDKCTYQNNGINFRYYNPDNKCIDDCSQNT